MLLTVIFIGAPTKRWIIVDSGQVIGIIIGVIVVLAIVAAAIAFNRRRKVAADRDRAAAMREQAKTDERGAREREAKAARAEADAKQAEVDAERLREEARNRQSEAESVRAGAQEQLRKADELDPDVVTTERGDAQAGTQGQRDAAGDGADDALRRDRTARNPESANPAANPDENPNRDEHPRNL
jgi:FtsZ-interacting cell division protein ZipA